MSRPAAGDVLLVDWRRGALPGEPTKIRPAVVVESPLWFSEDYANVLVVPLTTDFSLVHPTLAVPIEPTPENGATRLSWALAHHVTIAARQRTKETASRITPAQLRQIRERIAGAIDLEPAPET